MVKETVISLVIIAVSAWYFWQAGMLSKGSVDPLGSSVYPQLIAGAMIIFAVLHIIVTYFRRKRLIDDDELAPSQRLTGGLRAGGVAALTAAYLLLMGPLGYIIATLLYLLGILVLLGIRTVRGLSVASVGITVVLFLVFAQMLDVLLPSGFIGQLMEQ